LAGVGDGERWEGERPGAALRGVRGVEEPDLVEGCAWEAEGGNETNAKA